MKLRSVLFLDDLAPGFTGAPGWYAIEQSARGIVAGPFPTFAAAQAAVQQHNEARLYFGSLVRTRTKFGADAARKQYRRAA